MKNHNKIKNNKKEKVFAVTGHRGRLGSTLVNMGYLPIEMDITHPKEVREILGDINPDVLVNCASFTDVDACELNSLLQLNQVNGIAVGLIRNYFTGRLIQLSTDYVFNGRSGPYSENSPPDPLNQYGLSKLLGEELLREFDFPTDTIIRTTILYGSGVKEKPDFVTKVVSQLEKNNPVELPIFIMGNPTYIPHLALAIHHIAKMISPPKIVNVCGKEILSRYEFGLSIANEFGLDAGLISPIRNIPGIAVRPKKAGLKTDFAEKLGIPIYSVYDGLKEMSTIWKSLRNIA